MQYDREGTKKLTLALDEKIVVNKVWSNQPQLLAINTIRIGVGGPFQGDAAIASVTVYNRFLVKDEMLELQRSKADLHINPDCL